MGKKKVVSSSSSSSTTRSCLFPCYSQKSVQPFIAPFATQLDNRNETTTFQMNFSPRFVAYYEVTLVKRDRTQEPQCRNTFGRYSSASECVAIGLSLRTSKKNRVCLVGIKIRMDIMVMMEEFFIIEKRCYVITVLHSRVVILLVVELIIWIMLFSLHTMASF